MCFHYDITSENVKKLMSLLIINMYFNSLKRTPNAARRRQSKSKKSIFWSIIHIRIFNMLSFVSKMTSASCFIHLMKFLATHVRESQVS